MALRELSPQQEEPKKPDLKLVRDEEPEVLADNLMDLQKTPGSTKLEDLKPTQQEYNEAMAETKEKITAQGKIDGLHDQLYSQISDMKQAGSIENLSNALAEAKDKFVKAGKESLYQNLVNRYERNTAELLGQIITKIQNSNNKPEKLNLFDKLSNGISILDFETAGKLVSKFSDDKPKVGFMRRIFGGKQESQQDIYNRAFDQAQISRKVPNKQSTQGQELDAQAQSNAGFMRSIK